MIAKKITATVRTRRSYLGLALIVALISVAITYWPKSDHAPTDNSAPLLHEVYVWQRVWTDEVDTAASERLPEFSGATLLAIELEDTERGGWKVIRCQDALDYAARHDVTLAVRIGANEVVWEAPAIDQLLHHLESIAPLAWVIQIDYDCPSSKLGRYIHMLERVQERFPNHAIEITCLPDWLNRDEFEELVRLSDRYVMQVHGVSGYGGVGVLCDPNLARSTAVRCGKIGHPFLIALPTYRHAVRRDAGGKVREVISEGGTLQPGASYEMVAADHNQLAALVREWEMSRPAEMKGVIWYRLPVESERMNWTWQSLQSVMSGAPVTTGADAAVIQDDDGSLKIVLTNPHSARAEWPDRVEVWWSNGLCIAADGGHAYQVENRKIANTVSCIWRAQDPTPLPPGAKVPIAWLRLSEPQQVEVSTVYATPQQ